jgi:hypothetical protein
MSRRDELAGLRLTLDGDEWRVRTARSAFVCVEDGKPSEPLAGLTDTTRRTITVARDLPGPDLADTLLHEILHAIFPHGTVSRAKEERIVGVLEHRLRTAITRNDLGALLARVEKRPAPKGTDKIRAAKRRRRV